MIKAPKPLTDEYNLESFDCGVPSLNDWFKSTSRQNEKEGASRTYVSCVENKAIGYYCLAAGSIERESTPGKVRRNMPNPIPVFIIGRLAVDKNWRGRGLGSSLLKDAILKSLSAASIIGARAIIIHALSEDAKIFYKGYGFIESPIDPMTLMIPIKTVKATLE